MVPVPEKVRRASRSEEKNDGVICKSESQINTVTARLTAAAKLLHFIRFSSLTESQINAVTARLKNNYNKFP